VKHPNPEQEISPNPEADAIAHPEVLSLHDPAPLVAIGGLLTVKRLAIWYEPLLAQDTTSQLEARERFVAPPKRGIATPEDLRTELTESLEEMHQLLGYRKMFLAGHSLGGLLATAVAVERPDLVCGVVSLGGVHTGYKTETAATFALRYALGNPDEAKHLKHDSPFMIEHKERMASEWSEDIPLHIISTPLDTLVVPPQGYDVELPEGCQLEKRLIVTPLSDFPIQLLRHIPKRFPLSIPKDVKALPSLATPEHVYIPRNGAVMDYVNESRLAITGHGVTEEASAQAAYPSGTPLPAAA
jgi:hypothetical protein